MPIEPKCCKCYEILTDFGGLLISPPMNGDLCRKLHLCRDCYYYVVQSTGIYKELMEKVAT